MRFQPGQSGNPAGRPPGSLNKRTLAVEALFMAQAEETVTILMERAKEGHPTAMRLFMTRALPMGRDRPVAITLPGIREPEDARAAMAVVTAALAAGDLTISEATALLNFIDRMLRLAERIRKIEQMRRDEATADAAAPPAVAAAQAPTATSTPASPAVDEADESGAEPLYSPVNHESYSHDTASAADGAAHGDKGSTPVAAGNPAEPLYFPVNEAA
ncbi:MAG TPA: DUF5681 domain-containing protein [Xanthobacteraceae bacterium]|nr:DUF5681 domain-containing protein [Xanthobacteraceae bacterium]